MDGASCVQRWGVVLRITAAGDARGVFLEPNAVRALGGKSFVRTGVCVRVHNKD